MKQYNETGQIAIGAPTGSGKTLMLLCSLMEVMSVAGEKREIGTQTKRRIIYCSRTNDQLANVYEEFSKTVYSKQFVPDIKGVPHLNS